MKEFNPGYKGATIFLISLILSFEYNYYILLGVSFISFLILLYNKKLGKKFFLTMVPVLIICIGVFFTGYFYSNKEVINEVKSGDIETAIQLSARVLAFAMIGLVFVFTTNPRMFILSLHQQFKLPRSFSYGIMAGYNFIPTMQKEYRNMVSAYQARGIKRRWIVFPLLVTAVRSSENIALAMESKGFSSNGERSESVQLKVGVRDYLLITLIPIIILIVVIFY